MLTYSAVVSGPKSSQPPSASTLNPILPPPAQFSAPPSREDDWQVIAKAEKPKKAALPYWKIKRNSSGRHLARNTSFDLDPHDSGVLQTYPLKKQTDLKACQPSTPKKHAPGLGPSEVEKSTVARRVGIARVYPGTHLHIRGPTVHVVAAAPGNPSSSDASTAPLVSSQPSSPAKVSAKLALDKASLSPTTLPSSSSSSSSVPHPSPSQSLNEVNYQEEVVGQSLDRTSLVRGFDFSFVVERRKLLAQARLTRKVLHLIVLYNSRTSAKLAAVLKQTQCQAIASYRTLAHKQEKLDAIWYNSDAGQRLKKENKRAKRRRYTQNLRKRREARREIERKEVERKQTEEEEGRKKEAEKRQELLGSEEVAAAIRENRPWCYKFEGGGSLRILKSRFSVLDSSLDLESTLQPDSTVVTQISPSLPLESVTSVPSLLLPSLSLPRLLPTTNLSLPLLGNVGSALTVRGGGKRTTATRTSLSRQRANRQAPSAEPHGNPSPVRQLPPATLTSHLQDVVWLSPTTPVTLLPVPTFRNSTLGRGNCGVNVTVECVGLPEVVADQSQLEQAAARIRKVPPQILIDNRSNPDILDILRCGLEPIFDRSPIHTSECYDPEHQFEEIVKAYGRDGQWLGSPQLILLATYFRRPIVTYAPSEYARDSAGRYIFSSHVYIHLRRTIHLPVPGLGINRNSLDGIIRPELGQDSSSPIGFFCANNHFTLHGNEVDASWIGILDDLELKTFQPEDFVTEGGPSRFYTHQDFVLASSASLSISSSYWTRQTDVSLNQGGDVSMNNIGLVVAEEELRAIGKKHFDNEQTLNLPSCLPLLPSSLPLLPSSLPLIPSSLPAPPNTTPPHSVLSDPVESTTRRRSGRAAKPSKRFLDDFQPSSVSDSHYNVNEYAEPTATLASKKRGRGGQNHNQGKKQKKVREDKESSELSDNQDEEAEEAEAEEEEDSDEEDERWVEGDVAEVEVGDRREDLESAKSSVLYLKEITDNSLSNSWVQSCSSSLQAAESLSAVDAQAAAQSVLNKVHAPSTLSEVEQKAASSKLIEILEQKTKSLESHLNDSMKPVWQKEAPDAWEGNSPKTILSSISFDHLVLGNWCMIKNPEMSASVLDWKETRETQEGASFVDLIPHYFCVTRSGQPIQKIFYDGEGVELIQQRGAAILDFACSNNVLVGAYGYNVNSLIQANKSQFIFTRCEVRMLWGQEKVEGRSWYVRKKEQLTGDGTIVVEFDHPSRASSGHSSTFDLRRQDAAIRLSNALQAATLSQNPHANYYFDRYVGRSSPAASSAINGKTVATESSNDRIHDSARPLHDLPLRCQDLIKHYSQIPRFSELVKNGVPFLTENVKFSELQIVDFMMKERSNDTKKLRLVPESQLDGEQKERLKRADEANKLRHQYEEKVLREQQFRCKQCRLTFSTARKFHDHISTHTGLYRFNCGEEGCRYRTNSHSQLESHSSTHTGVYRFNCEEEGCTYKCNWYFKLESHSSTHTGVYRFNCGEEGCRYRTNSHSQLESHSSTHTGVYRFNCGEEGCRYRTNSHSELESHSSTHTGVYRFNCEEEGCTYKCNWYFKLENHISTHTGVYRFNCGEEGCRYRTNSHSELESHSSTHTGVYRFNCEEEGCTYKCNWYFKLESHSSTHTGVYRFNCGEEGCTYKCNWYSIFERHSAIHRNPKQHACTIGGCSKRFTRNSDLTRHVKDVHNSNNQFQCPDCGKTYKRKQDLKRHQFGNKSTHAACTKAKT